MKKLKISKGFSNALFVMSLLGILSIIIRLYGFNSYENVVLWFVTTVLGLGLMVEGKIRLLLKYFRKGLTMVELGHIITIIVGVIITFSGLYGLITGTLPERFEGIVGIAYWAALVVTIYERKI